jgi:DNA polymerase III delta subunit
MEPDQFERELSSPERKTFYVIAGQEPSSVRRCLEAARACVDPDFFRMNYRQRHAEDLNKQGGWRRLEGELAGHPFGRPPRMIVVKVSPYDKLPAEATEVLARLRTRINPAATLALFVESVPNLKVFKEAAKDGLEVDCRPPDKAQLPHWLMERFRVRGAALTPDGARAMIDRAGDDVGVLEGEAEKLSIFPGTADPIGPEQVARWVSLAPTAEIFELGSPFGSGQLDQGMSTMMDLLENSEPFTLIYPLGTHFRRLLKLKAILLAHGGRLDDQSLAQAGGVKPGHLRFLRPQLQRWSLGALKKAIRALVEAHRSMFTSRTPQGVILQELAVKLALLPEGG